MAGWMPYSTNQSINNAYIKKEQDKEDLERCRKSYPDTQTGYDKCVPNPYYKKIGPSGVEFYDYSLEDWFRVAKRQAPPREICSTTYESRINNKCYDISRKAKESAEALEKLEREESFNASTRKNNIINAQNAAKKLADDTAALPGLKRDELACNEISDRTRCRQLRERIADIEKRLAGGSNAAPTSPNTASTYTSNPPAATQVALPPKPFTLNPKTPIPPKRLAPKGSARKPRTGVRTVGRRTNTRVSSASSA